MSPSDFGRKSGQQAETDHNDGEEADAVDEAEAQFHAERKLRDRSVQQTNPYKFDKFKHNLQKTGRQSDTKKVQRAMQEEMREAQNQSSRNKARVFNSRSTNVKPATTISTKETATKARRSESVLSMPTSPNYDEHRPGFDPARVSLRVRLDGFAGAAAPVTLKDCGDMEQLMEFIVSAWQWRFGSSHFSYAVASFPWLNEKSNILLRAGLTDSFRGLVTEVERAPTWAQGERTRCEVDVTVYLQ